MAYALAVLPALAGVVVLPWWPLGWPLFALAGGIAVVGAAAERGRSRALHRDIAGAVNPPSGYVSAGHGR